MSAPDDLSAEEQEIWDHICLHMQPEDRDPSTVVREQFHDDWHAYFRAMAPVLRQTAA